MPVQACKVGVDEGLDVEVCSWSNYHSLVNSSSKVPKDGLYCLGVALLWRCCEPSYLADRECDVWTRVGGKV